MSRKILLVEDDQTTSDYIANGLIESGYVVDVAGDGRDGLFHASDDGYAAVLLDYQLPKMDGLAVVTAMRAMNIETPVLMVSARARADERVRGLRAGADDYVAKPFSFAELLARTEAIIRRRLPLSAPVTKLECADLELDLLSRRARRGERTIELQPREFSLLEYLLRHKGQVVTRTMLLEGVWNYYFDPTTNVVDVHVSRIRRKCEAAGEAQLLHTARGAGYMLVEPS